MGSNLVQSDPKDFAPRLGIAWSPTANWTVRAGAGIFFSQDTGNPVFDMARNLAGRVNNTANTNTHNLTFENPFNTAQGVCGVPVPPYVCITSPFVLGNNYNRRTPYMEQYELNIQRQLGNNTALEIGYLGSQGHRLERIQYFNQPTPGPGSTASREPWPEFGFVQEVIGLVSSNYNSLGAKLTRRMSNGFTFLLGYTFSKSIDNGSGERIIGTDNIDAQNEYCMSCERGLSSFDQRQRFVASTLYQLPFGRGRAFMNHGLAGALAGGWDLGMIWNMASGSPVDIYDGKDQSNTGVGQDRPNVVPGQAWKLGHPTPQEWFNVQAFALQPQYSFGNLGRNVVIGPPLFTVDSSIKKDLKFSERRYLELRLDAFNVFNHPNFGDPGNALVADHLTGNGVPIPGTRRLRPDYQHQDWRRHARIAGEP